MKTRLAVGAILALVVAGTAAFAQESHDEPEGEATSVAPPLDPAAQPIRFVHNVHAGSAEGQFRIDCQYCHFSAERSVDAGIPPVATCMGCHLSVQGSTERAQTEIAKIGEHFVNGRAIEWVRIYKVSDHAHFPHLRHIKAEVACQTCHGEVQEMGVIEKVNQQLYMGWCVTCHKERGASTDCTSCHY
jgi:hypothetical protein